MITFVGPRLRLRDRLDHLAISAKHRILSARTWVRARLQVAERDERGLTTAEYVALGAVVVVAAGVVGGLIAAFITARGNQITNTP